MSLSEQKKIALYHFYLRNGFDNSVHNIANGLNISDKTFFNRYVDKDNSVKIAYDYWQKICKKRWEDIKKHCNNEIEELLMLIFTIDKTRSTEPIFYYYTRDNRIFLNKNSFIFSEIFGTLLNGTQKFYVRENLSLELFTTFVLNNVFLIEVDLENRADVLKFILHAALTERGVEILNETPFV